MAEEKWKVDEDKDEDEQPGKTCAASVP